jgi:demethylmenaquinone methyltransferase/2-methoxy-6-polyprenyl-1,4-benzoquinol methylase
MSRVSETDFGYQRVEEKAKAARIAGVFSGVAARYDLMNDLMSFGLHRFWKIFTVLQSGVREGQRVLDVAGGSGDLALEFSRRVGASGEVWLTDINGEMLEIGRDRMLDRGRLLPAVRCDAEQLPFRTNYFDCVSVAFGLRNMTHKDRALAEMQRVLRPGGRLLVLEFSRVWSPLAKAYDWYSFNVLPWLGRRFAGNEAAYRYLAESIRMHPDQEGIKLMLERAGLENVEYFNLSAGVVALHRGYKF